MAEAVPAAGAPKVSRLDRRKARTRQALIDAAVRLIAEGRGDRASIAEITEEADIGFGSFYNHFDSKEQLFQTASEEVLERWGQLIDRATAGITDPAELFAVGTRISGRLGWTHPDIAGFLTGAGLDALDIPGGLAPRALRDIRGRAGRGPVHRPRCRDRAQRRGRRPARAAADVPAAPRTRQRDHRRPARRGRAAPARRPSARSRPPGRPPPPGHRHLVTAPGRTWEGRPEDAGHRSAVLRAMRAQSMEFSELDVEYGYKLPVRRRGARLQLRAQSDPGPAGRRAGRIGSLMPPFRPCRASTGRGP